MTRRMIFWLLVACAVFTAVYQAKKAWAGVSCSVPFNLTNGTTADASQVMANYNAILNCLLNNTAESGSNNSITALTGLTTPVGPSQGGTSSFIGSSVVGTNSISVATTTPSSFSLTANYTVTFVAAGSNTGATQLGVLGTGLKNFYRQTPAGVAPMVGGEIVTGQTVTAAYDGTQYQMTSAPALGHAPGELFDFAGASCPVGATATIGGILSQTTYPTAYAVLGALWGTNAGGNFTLPDLRGRATFSADSGGSGRITAAGGNFDGTVVGNVGGQQNNIVNKVNLAAFALNVTDPGHTHTASNGFAILSNAPGSSLGGNTTGSGTTLTTSTTGVTVASGGSSTPLPTLSNAAIVLKCVKL